MPADGMVVSAKNDVTAIILAGGQSRRMRQSLSGLSKGNQPTDKAWLSYQGKSLIRWALGSLPDVKHVIVSTRRADPRYAELGQVITDLPWLGEGPLAGLASCLGHVKTPYAAVLPCDILNWPVDWLSRLRNARVPACYASTERPHYLCALLQADLHQNLLSFLAQGCFSVQAWYQTLPAMPVQFAVDQQFFINCNTVDDLPIPGLDQ